MRLRTEAWKGNVKYYDIKKLRRDPQFFDYIGRQMTLASHIPHELPRPVPVELLCNIYGLKVSGMAARAALYLSGESPI